MSEHIVTDPDDIDLAHPNDEVEEPDEDDLPEIDENAFPPEVWAEFQAALDEYTWSLIEGMDAHFAQLDGDEEDVDYEQTEDIAYRDAGEFKEGDHPRGGNPANRGQFSKGAGSGGGGESSEAPLPSGWKTAVMHKVQGIGEDPKLSNAEKIAQIEKLIEPYYKGGPAHRHAMRWVKELQQGQPPSPPPPPEKKEPPPPPTPPPSPPPTAVKREVQAETKEREARLREHARTMPEPSRFAAGAGKKLQELVRGALENGEDAKKTSAMIVDFAGQYKHHAVSVYGNALLRHLESAHGLPPKSLGKAVPKRSEPPQPMPPPKPPQGKIEPPPPAPPAPPKGAPTSIHEVLASRKDWSDTERKYHGSTWTQATPEFLAAMKNTQALSRVNVGAGVHAHYQGGNHSISMSPKDSVVVWRHEYGHAMDYNGGFQMRSYDADNHRREEATALIRAWNYPGDPKMPTTPLSEVRAKHGISEMDLTIFTGAYAPQRDILDGVLTGRDFSKVGILGRNQAHGDEALMYKDFLGAMTNNKIGYGHTDQYYQARNSRHCGEMFANYVALTQGPGGKVWKAILHSVAPKSCAHFAKIISDTAALPGAFQPQSFGRKRA